MAPPPINVNATAKNITVTPTRLYLKSDQGVVTLNWQASGNDVELILVRFDKGNAPISNLRQLSNGNWTGEWDTDVASTIWKYSIQLKANGTVLPILDPEVENGPPGGVDPDGGG